MLRHGVDEFHALIIRREIEMTTLTILGRVNRHLGIIYGAPLPYDIAILKRVIVIGLCRDRLGATINHLSALTCETAEETTTLLNKWRTFDPPTQEAWWKVVSDE